MVYTAFMVAFHATFVNHYIELMKDEQVYIRHSCKLDSGIPVNPEIFPLELITA